MPAFRVGLEWSHADILAKRDRLDAFEIRIAKLFRSFFPPKNQGAALVVLADGPLEARGRVIAALGADATDLAGTAEVSPREFAAADHS
jgi:hypothetical protein